jgi:hypothetical protein
MSNGPTTDQVEALLHYIVTFHPALPSTLADYQYGCTTCEAPATDDPSVSLNGEAVHVAPLCVSPALEHVSFWNGLNRPVWKPGGAVPITHHGTRPWWMPRPQPDRRNPT